MAKYNAHIFFIFLVAILGFALIWPLFTVIGGGIVVDGHWTLEYIFGVFKNPIYLEGLIESLKIAIGTTILSIIFALPLAWIGTKFNFRGKTFLSSLILVPLILPPFVGAIGITQLLGPYGVLNALLGLGPIDWLGKSRYFGVVIIQALSLYPIVYLNLSAAIANIDPAMEEAAASLGASPIRTFRRITLPLMMPGFFAGITLVFIAAYTELGTPLMLGITRCAPCQIYDEIKEISSSPFPYALVTCVLFSSVMLYLIMRLSMRKSTLITGSKAVIATTAKSLNGRKSILASLPFLIVSLLALIPHIGVILTSFSVPGTWYKSILPLAYTTQNFVSALSHEMTITAVRSSLIFSVFAVILNVLLGVAIATICVRTKVRGRALLDTLAMIPLAVPGLVMAFGYNAISTHICNKSFVVDNPYLLNLLDIKTNPTLLLVIAYAVRRLPFMVRAASAGLEQASVTLEEAALNLGATPLRTFRKITAPLITANIIAGTLLVFSFSMLEVSDSLLLAQKSEYYPITKTIFEFSGLIGIGRHLASSLGVWAMAFLAITILGSSLLLGKKLGSLFRA